MLLVLLLTLSIPVAATAATPLRVFIDGEEKFFTPAPAIINSSTLVPMRAFFQALGASVGWDGTTRTVTSVKGNITVKLTINSKDALVNGQVRGLSVPAQIIGQSTFIPLRFVGEALGAKVGYANRTITITSAVEAPTVLTPKEIYAAASPAVVLINTFRYDGTPLGVGSGFIVEPTGKIVTNYHVIENACSATVKLTDGRVFDVARVLSYDENADIAILKVEGTGLPVVKLGDSSKVENGEDVVVIGSPFGLESTITDGLVSNASRLFEDGHSYIQTSAPVSPGNSGGPLFNDRGEVIGVVTWKISTGENVNFAIPINEVLPYISATDAGTTLQEMFDAVKPTAPTGVKALAINSSQIIVDWDDDPTVDYFHVYYSGNQNGTFVPFADSQGNKLQLQWDPNEYSAMLEGVPAGATRYFKITAVRNGEESVFSELAEATTYGNQQTLTEVEYNDDYDVADYYPVEFAATPHVMQGDMDPTDFDYFWTFMDSSGTIYVEVFTGGTFPGDLLFWIEDQDGTLVTYFTTDEDGWIRAECYLERGLYYFELFSDLDSTTEGSYLFTVELSPDN